MKLDEFTTAYIECMLWSTNDESTPEGGNPLDDNFGIEDIDDDSLRDIIVDCAAFQKKHVNDIVCENILDPEDCFDAKRAGHDFWLTRNGHGAGFWDGEWKEEAGKRMCETSDEVGEVCPYVGDDGKIHLT